jgi:hypothetical protein
MPFFPKEKRVFICVLNPRSAFDRFSFPMPNLKSCLIAVTLLVL